MDTRKKIVPFANVQPLLANGEWLVITGLFDPLTAVQAKRVAECAKRGRPLLIAVLDEAGTLLPAEARAALMASLRDVRLVTIATAGTQIGIAEDAQAERARSAEFIDLVLKRETS